MNIVIFGAPASGKGSLSSGLIKEFGFVHIATGDAFRAEMAEGTEVGAIAKGYIENGQLVPDKYVNAIIDHALENHKGKNIIFDGYPRSIEQAHYLAQFTKIDAVIELVVDREELIARMTSRMMCKECNEIHNKRYDKCDKCKKCGGELYQRSDDNEEAANLRLDTFKNQTSKVLQYFTELGLVKTFKATTGEAPQVMIDRVVKFLKEEIK